MKCVCFHNKNDVLWYISQDLHHTHTFYFNSDMWSLCGVIIFITCLAGIGKRNDEPKMRVMHV